jgi:hypothetical protein
MTTEYSTKDLGEAGALIVKDQKLIRIDRKGKTCWFVFEDKEECERLSADFFFGELQVNARSFYEAITRLKHRIFSFQ